MMSDKMPACSIRAEDSSRDPATERGAPMIDRDMSDTHRSVNAESLPPVSRAPFMSRDERDESVLRAHREYMRLGGRMRAQQRLDATLAVSELMTATMPVDEVPALRALIHAADRVSAASGTSRRIAPFFYLGRGGWQRIDSQVYEVASKSAWDLVRYHCLEQMHPDDYTMWTKFEEPIGFVLHLLCNLTVSARTVATVCRLTARAAAGRCAVAKPGSDICDCKTGCNFCTGSGDSIGMQLVRAAQDTERCKWHPDDMDRLQKFNQAHPSAVLTSVPGWNEWMDSLHPWQQKMVERMRWMTVQGLIEIHPLWQDEAEMVRTMLDHFEQQAKAVAERLRAGMVAVPLANVVDIPHDMLSNAQQAQHDNVPF